MSESALMQPERFGNYQGQEILPAIENNLPAIIVEDLNTQTARLPAAYKAAQIALANCAGIDECREWVNKAQALASYARQADDDTLQKHAMRIQSRAVRRCGELLKEFDGRPVNAEKQSAGADTLFSESPAPTQRQIAEDAGMSKRQQVTAVRVANVPGEVFEAAVESDDPPTVTALAHIGKRSLAIDPMGPIEYIANVTFKGHTLRFAAFCQKHDPVIVASGVGDYYAREVRREVAQIRRWLKSFSAAVRGQSNEL